MILNDDLKTRGLVITERHVRLLSPLSALVSVGAARQVNLLHRHVSRPHDVVQPLEVSPGRGVARPQGPRPYVVLLRLSQLAHEMEHRPEVHVRPRVVGTNLDGPPVQPLGLDKLPGLPRGHGGVEDGVVVARVVVFRLPEVGGGLLGPVLVHKEEAVVEVDRRVPGGHGQGALEPRLGFLVAGRLKAKQIK